jgi:hypothetical protein
MRAIAFDRHAFVTRLTATGMPEPQAEALADEQRRLIEARCATGPDLVSFVADLRRVLAEIETRLTVRAGGMVVVWIAVIAALLKDF